MKTEELIDIAKKIDGENKNIEFLNELLKIMGSNDANDDGVTMGLANILSIYDADKITNLKSYPLIQYIVANHGPRYAHRQ